MGLRLQLRKAQAEAGDIILLYGTERGPDAPLSGAGVGLARCGPAGAGAGQAKKVAIIGSLDHVTRQLSVHTSQTKRSRDFIAHLEQLDHLFGPHPGRAIKPVVLVEDNGPVHVSKLTLKAIEVRKHRLTVESLPKYAPELNDIEFARHNPQARHLAHQTFADADALDRAIHAAVAALNRERTVNPLVIQNIFLEDPANPWRSVTGARTPVLKWRRGRDSNPRYACAYSAFRVRRDRPLCHLSEV